MPAVGGEPLAGAGLWLGASLPLLRRPWPIPEEVSDAIVLGEKRCVFLVKWFVDHVGTLPEGKKKGNENRKCEKETYAR